MIVAGGDPVKHLIRFAAALLGVLVFQFVFAQPLFAQHYPSRPLHVIIPFATGGVTDILARTLAPVITEQMGQPVVVDDRPGGASIIGMTACARAAPDGYTICIANPDAVSYHPHVYASLPYNPQTDFAPIINLGWTNNLIVANTRMPFNTYKEMIAHARRNPGALNWATWGPGSLPDVHLQWITRQAGVNITAIPYKGSGQANPALLSGEADLGWIGIGVAGPLIKSGKLKPLVATGAQQRTRFMPDLPTLAEEGGDPGLRSYFGVFAPARTPGAIVDRLNTELARAIRTPPLLEFYRNYTLEAIDNSAAEFAAFVKADRENAGNVFRGMGIKPGAAPQ